MSPLTIKLALLDQLYRIYDDFTRQLNVACRLYCADCCTCNVSLTTLEGLRIIEHLQISGETQRLQALDHVPHTRFRPAMTTNQYAECCVRGEAHPQEAPASPDGRCPLLQDASCPIYAVRPFGCRCLFSRNPCHEKGYAEIDPFVLTVNDVFLQYIEHIDRDGGSGNLTDVLRYLAAPEAQRRYRDSALESDADGLVANRPIKYLMIPPEHRRDMAPILTAIQKIRVPAQPGESPA